MSENRFHPVNAFLIRNFLIGCGFGFLLLTVVCGWVSWKENKRDLERQKLEIESDLRKTAFAIDRETRNFWNISLYIARLIEREHGSLETWHIEDAESRFLDFIKHFSDVTYFSIELFDPAQSWGWERSLSYPDEWALLLDYNRDTETEDGDGTNHTPLPESSTQSQFKLVASAEGTKVYSQVEAFLKSGEKGSKVAGKIVLRRPWENVFLNSEDEKFFLVDAKGTVWRPIYQSTESVQGPNTPSKRISLWTQEEDYFEKTLGTSWDELWRLPREERISLDGNSLFINPAVQLKDQPVWWVASYYTKDEISRKQIWTRQPMIWLVLGSTPVLGLCWLGLVRSRNLQESSARRLNSEKDYFKTLVEALPIPVYFKNSDGYLLDCNKAALHFLGLSEKEVLSKKLSTLLDPDLEAAFQRYDHETLHGQNQSNPITLERLNQNDEIQSHLIYQGKANGPGAMGAGIVGVILDESDKKRSEKRLIRDQKKLEKIATQIPGVIFQFKLFADGRSCFPYASAGIQDIYQVTPDEVVTSAALVFEKIHPEDLKKVRDSIKESAANLKPWKLEYRVKYSDNSVRWLYGNSIPEKDPSDQSVLWHGFITDITEIKRIQQEKQSLIHRIQLATKAANIGVWIFDLRTGYLEWDETMFKVFDVKPDEFNHKLDDWKQRLHPEDIARALEEVTLTFQGKESLQTEFRIITSNGEVRHICAFAETEREKDQTPIRVIGVNWDITDEKRTQRELRLAKETAENVSRAKGAFLANMSHEIRTPMNGVMGMTNLLLQTELNQEQKECLEIIQKSGESLLGLVNDILDFSKVESGQLKLEMVAFQPAKVVADALSILAPLAYQKGLEMEYFIDSEIPDVFWGDETRVRQILINLVGNAIKFTPMGQVIVACKMTQRQATGQPEIEVCVQDSGIGIESHQIPKLFELFTQLDVSTTRKFGGTGLGLSISKNLVEKMGGRIWVESEPGHGSKFYFTLPQNNTAEENVQKIEDIIHEERIAADLAFVREALNDQLLLWIEPNEMVRRRVSVLADKLGLTIQTCKTFQQALERSKSQYIGKSSSLKTGPVVVNALIPGSSGLDIVRELSNSEIFANSPVLMTCYGPSSSILNSDLISGVIQKPLRPATVIAALKRALIQEAKDESLMAERSNGAESPEQNPESIERQIEDLPGKEWIGLIADDNPVNQRVCQFMLKRYGLNADSAYDGEEAVRLWQKRKYSFILMDIHMPQLDGYEAAKRILQLAKDHEEKPPCIIALSAAISESEKLKAQSVGMQAFLEKPLNGEKLRQTLTNLGFLAG